MQIILIFFLHLKRLRPLKLCDYLILIRLNIHGMTVPS